MVVLLKGSPLSTGQCWSSGWEVTENWWSLWQRPFYTDWLGVQLYEESRCFKLLLFMDYWGCCAHWDLQSCRNVSVRFPRSAPRYNPVLEVYMNSLNFMVWFVLCTLNCGILYRPVLVVSSQLRLPQVDSKQAVETSDRSLEETRCTWAQFCVSW